MIGYHVHERNDPIWRMDTEQPCSASQAAVWVLQPVSALAARSKHFRPPGNEAVNQVGTRGWTVWDGLSKG